MSQLTAAHYATGHTRQNIERALRSAGRDPSALAPEDLMLIEDFHALGRLGTAGLIQACGVGATDRVLDAGTGIGGTARVLALDPGCHVTAVDLTPEYCEVAAWLNALVGLEDRITVQQADVTALPFAAASFDVVISQHVQMNVAEKDALYAEARRVLTPGGRLALWDITAGPEQPLTFPVPWATYPELSHLVTPEQLLAITTGAGFEVAVWNDLTAFALQAITPILSAEPGPLGLHVFVPDFAVKSRNLLENANADRLRVIQAVLVAR